MSEVAACERRRRELAAPSALAAFSICEKDATSAAAPAGSTPVSVAADASLAARDAPWVWLRLRLRLRLRL